MREILFRGKRKDNGEWVEGYLYIKYFQELPHDRFVIEYKPKHNSKMWQPQYMIAEIDPDTIGQYTGLTDKNGTKIFEGDISKVYLEVPYLPSQPKTISAVGVVEFNTEKSCYYVVSTSGEEYALCFIDEVIGNIHDNPELLKEREGNEL